MVEQLLGYIIPGVIILALVLVFATSCYKVAKTDEVLVITGPRGKRYVTGKATCLIPFVMRSDRLSLKVIQCKLETDQPIPTKEGLLVNISAVANVQIGTTYWKDKEGNEINPLDIASKNYLNQGEKQMMEDVTQVLLGKMREAVGATNLTSMMQERDEFNATIWEAAQDDMRNLGLELKTFNVQDFDDKQDVIVNMGAEMAAQITKDANLARIKADTEVAEKQNEYDLKQADLKSKADRAKAEADMVYETTKAEKTKELNIATQNAEIAAEERRIELAQKQAAVTEQKLDADVKKKADADAYAAQKLADANAYAEEKRSAAALIVAKNDAEATKATAFADAEATEARGNAEGKAIQAKGEGEAAGIKAQGEAFEQNGRMILVQQYIGILPQLMSAAAEPLTKVDKITMYGEGNAAKLVGDTTNTFSQLNDAFAQTLGINLSDILKGAVTGSTAGKAIAKNMDTDDITTKNTITKNES